MLVSHGQQFIYMKTRKTAGSSVQKYFSPYCVAKGEPFPPDRTGVKTLHFESSGGIIGSPEPDPGSDGKENAWWHHMPASLVRERLGETWDRYTKFCCIRNPFDKVFSYFWYANFGFAEKYVNANREEIRGVFRAWLLADEDMASDRYVYTIGDNAPCLDVYIRYEHLETDLDALCARIGLVFEPDQLSWRKGQFRPKGLPFWEFYDRDTADRVRRTYDRELGWFGYADVPEEAVAPAAR